MPRIMRRLALAGVLGFAVGALGQQIANAQQVPDSRVADIARSGKLRVGMGLVPTFAIKDPATGEFRGVAIELARALAARIGVEVVPVTYPNPSNVLDGLKTDAWDVGFLGIEAARAAVADFSPPYIQVESTYLLPAGSSIRTIADADRSDIRLATADKSVEDIVLSRTIKHAQLVRVATMGAGFEALRAGKADVLAAPRPTALLLSGQLPGSLVLEDRFYAVFHGIAVAKGQTAHLSYVSEFIEEAKASGAVQRALDRAGLRGAKVAPPGSQSMK